MNQQTDSQLLRAYAEQRSEPAFAELVRRHVDLVHSAALRMVRDAHHAQDVTQGVFVALAKNAAQLSDRPVLAGWLHRTAQNIAAQTVRTDARRRAREQEAAAMNQLLADQPEAGWEQVAPLLDDALGELSEPDRDALLLRYFERKSAREMAQMLGVSDEAAQKRVSRAVERLREFFARRGVSVGASGLALSLTANAVQAAPAGLTATVSAAVVAVVGTGFAATAGSSGVAIKAGLLTSLQKHFLVAGLVAVVAVTSLYQAVRYVTVQSKEEIPSPTIVVQVDQPTDSQADAIRQLASQTERQPTPANNASESLVSREIANGVPDEKKQPAQSVVGNVRGRVFLSGTPPPETRIDLSRYPQLARQYPAGLMTRRYQIGSEGSLKNVMVSVRGDFGGKKFTPSTTPVVLNHGIGIFEPYIVGVQAGQPLTLARHPGVCAYVADARINKGFAFVAKESHTFTEPEVGIRFKCDGHPWNFTYLSVFDHPFFTVTDDNGAYGIQGVPPGRYTLEAWHPRAGTVSAEITVTEAEANTANLILNAK